MPLYNFQQRPNTSLTETGKFIVEECKARKINVLVGKNNSGKTWLLNYIRNEIGIESIYIGPNRYQNFSHLSAITPRDKKLAEQWRSLAERWRRSTQNFDESPVNVQQTISEFSDADRATLFEIVKNVLGFDMSVEQSIDGNEMSARYISLNGQNFSYASSGVRILVTLLACLLNKDHKIFLIDEPELGISPEGQRILSDFLLDDEMRAKYLPHVQSIFLATHSSLFLDTNRIENNYIVSKVGDFIDIARMDSLSTLSQAHFRLLGNRFEDLQLPSAIILVEGISDEAFISSTLSHLYPDAKISVVATNTDSQMKNYTHTIKSIFGDLQFSPYKDRIISVLDQKHESGLKSKLIDMGIPNENIVVWEKNGIEFVYPKSVLKEIFRNEEPLTIAGNFVSVGEIKYSKDELARMVVQRLNKDTRHTEEFEEKFLSKLRSLKS